MVRELINNFPPKQIPTGEWMMSRRPHDYKQKGVHFLVEHEGHLLIAFAGGKRTVEVLRVRISDLDKIEN